MNMKLRQHIGKINRCSEKLKKKQCGQNKPVLLQPQTNFDSNKHFLVHRKLLSIN